MLKTERILPRPVGDRMRNEEIGQFANEKLNGIFGSLKFVWKLLQEKDKQFCDFDD